MDSKYQVFDIEIRDIEANDWELFYDECLACKKFTIAGAKLGFRTPRDLYFYEEKDVELAIRRLIKDEHINSDGECINRIKTIFGDALLGADVK